MEMPMRGVRFELTNPFETGPSSQRL